ncbi:MAG: hypothetical protein GTN80_07135 [Nitrososphaeria archaeon]|nr:hypothetical protein [Nitrososphaeria archaeon]NIQ33400.1 hypothetical protein [Nitrososphaeria archaeon]
MKQSGITRTQTIVAITIVIIIIVGIGYYLILPSPTPTPTPTFTETPTLIEWKADGVIEENEYADKVTLADGKLTINWRSDDEYLYMALKSQTSGWVAIGFEPSVRMKDADMIFGLVKEGKVTVLDLYSTGVTGPHPPDEQLGGTNNIVEYGGKEENGFTTIEFKRKLDTGDEYDNSLTKKGDVSFIWAVADTDDSTMKHNIARGSGKITLK